MQPGSLHSHQYPEPAEAGVGQDGTLYGFLAEVEQKQGRNISFSLLPSSIPLPTTKGTFEVQRDSYSPLLSQSLPWSLVSGLRINLLVTLLNQFLPERGPGCKDDRNQTSNGFPGAEGSETFSCRFLSQGIKGRMWVTGLQQCEEGFQHSLEDSWEGLFPFSRSCP